MVVKYRRKVITDQMSDRLKEMFELIRAAFNQRRKTLLNAVGNAANLSYSKEQVREALSKMGKEETIRGEALTLQEFAELTELLTK